MNIRIPDDEIAVPVDSTGMKVACRDDCMKKTHGVERKSRIAYNIKETDLS